MNRSPKKQRDLRRVSRANFLFQLAHSYREGGFADAARLAHFRAVNHLSWLEDRLVGHEEATSKLFTLIPATGERLIDAGEHAAPRKT